MVLLLPLPSPRNPPFSINEAADGVRGNPATLPPGAAASLISYLAVRSEGRDLSDTSICKAGPVRAVAAVMGMVP